MSSEKQSNKSRAACKRVTHWIGKTDMLQGINTTGAAQFCTHFVRLTNNLARLKIYIFNLLIYYYVFITCDILVRDICIVKLLRCLLVNLFKLSSLNTVRCDPPISAHREDIRWRYWPITSLGQTSGSCLVPLPPLPSTRRRASGGVTEGERRKHLANHYSKLEVKYFNWVL